MWSGIGFDWEEERVGGSNREEGRGEEQGLYFLLLHVSVEIYAEHMLNISLLVRFRDLKMRFNWKHVQLWKY
jgi:hypothetical protein